MKISIAYSPDSDDAFMIHALKERIVPWGDYEFEFYRAEIQELNERAVNEDFDITALSVAAYMHVMDRYKVLKVGASVGDTYGPAVVAPKQRFASVADVKGQRIAVPGERTSAYYAASILLPTFTPVFCGFLEVRSFIEQGKADAGVLIHEAQIDYSSTGLEKIADLGALWSHRFSLPLPLGCIAGRTLLGEHTLDELQDLYRQSIRWGLNHRQECIEIARQEAVTKVGAELADRYISMYVNQRSLDLDQDVLNAIDLLGSEAKKLGLVHYSNS